MCCDLRYLFPSNKVIGHFITFRVYINTTLFLYNERIPLGHYVLRITHLKKIEDYLSRTMEFLHEILEE